jgi:hypothetical protein
MLLCPLEKENNMNAITTVKAAKSYLNQDCPDLSLLKGSALESYGLNACKIKLTGNRWKAIKPTAEVIVASYGKGWLARPWLVSLAYLGWSVDQLKQIPAEPLAMPVNEYILAWVDTLPHTRVIKYISPKTMTVHGREVKAHPQLILDAAQNWAWLQINHPEVFEGAQPRLRDLFEVHDYYYKLKVKLEPSFSIPVDESVKALIGSTFEGFSVEFPTESRTLKEWGSKLDHCVGGYGEAVQCGYSSIFSLNGADGEPVYTIEVDPDTMGLRQFFGFHNSNPPEELALKMEAIFPRAAK